MKVTIKFITPMMKNGIMRNPGDLLEIDATSAILLAEKGTCQYLVTLSKRSNEQLSKMF